jgi:hypothetical protein
MMKSKRSFGKDMRNKLGNLQGNPSKRQENTTSAGARSMENSKRETIGGKRTRDRRAYYATNKEKIRAFKRAYYATNKEKIRAYYATNKEKILAYQQMYEKNNPHLRLLISARRRSKRKGLPCTITPKDIVIPERCPLLNTPLRRNVGGKVPGPNSPSLDRLIPALGYIPRNVIVISNRANLIKQDATLQELKDLTNNLEKILTERFRGWKGTEHEETHR